MPISGVTVFCFGVHGAVTFPVVVPLVVPDVLPVVDEVLVVDVEPVVDVVLPVVVAEVVELVVVVEVEDVAPVVADVVVVVDAGVVLSFLEQAKKSPHTINVVSKKQEYIFLMI